MRDRLIDALIQGDRLAWAAIAVVWGLTALIVLLYRPGLGGARGAAWTWLLFAAATSTSLAGLPLSAAIAVPRVRWATVDAPELVAATGETWRRLRGPAVMVEGPDLAVPTRDAEGRWVLFGLLSGQPVAGLPAAEPAPMMPGAPRLCRAEAEPCRPWPVAWPDPAHPLPLGELSWGRAGSPGFGAERASAGRSPIAGSGEPVIDGSALRLPHRVEDALAYDAESGLYLRRVEPAPGARAGDPVLELVGRVTVDESSEGPPVPSVLFVLRKVAAGRLRAMRMVSVPSSSGRTFRLERAAVSLTTGPRVFVWAVRPLLALTSFALPLGVLAFLLAPLLHRARRGAAPKTPPEDFAGRSSMVSTGSRRDAAAWIGPYLEGSAVLAAGVAAAAPAVVALASLWGSR